VQGSIYIAQRGRVPAPRRIFWLSSRRFYFEFRKRYPALTERKVNRGASFEGVGVLIDGRYPDCDLL
jgi:hypothetical protein